MLQKVRNQRFRLPVHILCRTILELQFLKKGLQKKKSSRYIRSQTLVLVESTEIGPVLGNTSSISSKNFVDFDMMSMRASFFSFVRISASLQVCDDAFLVSPTEKHEEILFFRMYRQ